MESSQTENSAKPAKRRRMPYVTGFLITAFWLAMMTSLMWDQVLQRRNPIRRDSPSVELARLTRDWRDYEENMVVKMGPARVGAATTSVRKNSGDQPGYTADFRFAIGLNLLGMMRNVSIAAHGELDDKFDLRRFHIKADLAPVNFRITGLADGQMLLVETVQGQERSLARHDLGRNISLLDAVRPVATRNFEIKPGNSISLPVVDPVWSMEHGTLTLTVGEPEKMRLAGKEVEAFPVEMRLNEFVSTSWVDKDGNTLRRNLIGNLVLERTTTATAASWGLKADDELAIPELRKEDFADVPARKLEKLQETDRSPLSILGALVRQ